MQILDANIDVGRRQAFVFSHGSAVPVLAGLWTTLSTAANTLQAALESVDQILAGHFAAVAHRHKAQDVDYTAHGFIAASNMKAALDERRTDMVEKLVRVGVLTPDQGRVLVSDIFNRRFAKLNADWGGDQLFGPVRFDRDSGLARCHWQRGKLLCPRFAASPSAAHRHGATEPGQEAQRGEFRDSCPSTSSAINVDDRPLIVTDVPRSSPARLQNVSTTRGDSCGLAATPGQARLEPDAQELCPSERKGARHRPLEGHAPKGFHPWYTSSNLVGDAAVEERI